MTKIQKEIRTALGAPTSAARIAAFLAIDGRGCPGAVTFRARKHRLAARLERKVPDEGWAQTEAFDRAMAAVARAARTGTVRAAIYGMRSRARLQTRQAADAATAQAAMHARRERLCAHYVEVVAARGGETKIEGAYGAAYLKAADCDADLMLLRAEGWRQYSRRYGARRATLAYLAGRDDSGDWAVRVPGTVTTVAGAESWLMPAAVRRAQAQGRTVRRQGDVYAVGCAARYDLAGLDTLPPRHNVVGGLDAGAGRWLTHPEHAPLWLGEPTRLFPQSALAMGRQRRSRRAFGD